MSCGVLSKYFVPPSRMSAVSSREVSNPGRSRCSRRNPRIIRPAPTSSTIDSATSATRSALRPPAPVPLVPRAPSLSTSLRSVRDARNAGSRPNTRLDPIEIASANPSTRVSTWMCRNSSGKPAGTISAKSRVPQKASTSPKPHPTSESSRFSVRSCWTSRLAPCPGRGAQRELLLPCRAGREQQVRHVGARDQQNETHGAEKEGEPARRAAEERLVEQDDLGRCCRRASRRVLRSSAGQ